MESRRGDIIISLRAVEKGRQRKDDSKPRPCVTKVAIIMCETFSAELLFPLNRSFAKRPEHSIVENLYGYFRRKESRGDH